MKTKIMRMAAFVLAFVMSTALMTGCKKDKTEETPNANLYDLTGFTIVRDSNMSSQETAAVSALKQAIKQTVGVDLAVSIDTETEVGAKEILVGRTNRTESTATEQYLKKYSKDESWAIRIAENKIVIMGTDELSTRRAISEFVYNYVNVSSKGTSIDVSAGYEQKGVYDEDNITVLDDGSIIHLDYIADIAQTGKTYHDIAATGGKVLLGEVIIPSVIELNYQLNAEDNGKLVVIMQGGRDSYIGISQADATESSVFMSTDRGKTWKCLTKNIKSKYFPSWECPIEMSYLYELPVQMGDMPAGTLLCAHNVLDIKDGTASESVATAITISRSFDLGLTWEEYCVIDRAGGEPNGVWEPFLIYGEEDGYLYCFYSDDSNPAHDQMIAYKRSKDGVNWEGIDGKIGKDGIGNDVEPVKVVAMNDFAARPGMPIITKMGNGEYFMVYEYFPKGTGEGQVCPVYYRTTKNLADWGDPNNAGTLMKTPDGTNLVSGPACIWSPAGGDCGTLIVNSTTGTQSGYMLVSTDYGKTWEKIDNPLSGTPIKTQFDRIGYRSIFWLGADGKTVYYVNTINSKYDKTSSTVACATMTVYKPLI